MKAVKMDVEGRRGEVEVECAERTIWASPENRQRLHIHGWERRSWAASGHLRIRDGDYGGGSPGQGRKRSDRKRYWGFSDPWVTSASMLTSKPRVFIALDALLKERYFPRLGQVQRAAVRRASPHLRRR